MKGMPLSPFEIERLKHAGDAFAGEKRLELIALAALEHSFNCLFSIE